MNMIKLRGRLRTVQPRTVRVLGKFGLYRGDNERCHLDFKNDAGLTNLDTIIEAVALQDAGKKINVETKSGITSAKATINSATLGLDKLDCLFTYNTAVGVAGNAWKLNVMPHTILGGGVVIYDDTTRKVLTAMYEDGVSTVTDLIAAVGGSTDIVASGGTGANILGAGADDDYIYNLSFSGGVDTVAVTVTHHEDVHDVLIEFEDSVATVLEAETAIGALSGADQVIQVQTAGSPAGVLTAADDTLPARELCDWKAPHQVGRGFLVVRTGDGTYTIRLSDKHKSLVRFKAELEHGAAAAYPCDVKRTAGLTGNTEIPIGLYDNVSSAIQETNYSAANMVTFVAELLV